MKETQQQFTFVPFERMEELMEKIEKLAAALNAGKNPDNGILGDFISEKDAKILLSKGTTWFWNKRQSGELLGRKAGNQWYYSKSEIQSLIGNGKSSKL